MKKILKIILGAVVIINIDEEDSNDVEYFDDIDSI